MASDTLVDVSIWAKYSSGYEDFTERCTGQEIFDYLMGDHCGCFHPSSNDKDWPDYDRPILGDRNIWYLTTNEKKGGMEVDGEGLTWGWGGSGTENVNKFISILWDKELITTNQATQLTEAVEETKKFICCYNINDYLIAKSKGEEYVIPNPDWREESMEFFGHVKNHFEDEGYTLV